MDRPRCFLVAVCAGFAACAGALALDTTPPRVTGVDPAPGATVTSPPSTILITFNEDIDPATVTVDTIRLVRSGGDGTFGDGNEVAITPVSVTRVEPAGDQAEMNLTGVALPNDVYQVTADGTSSLGTGLVGHWEFEDSGGIATDSSTYANDGTLVNAPTWEPVGRIGQALRLNGTNQYVNLGNPPSLNVTKNFTIAAWVYPDTITGGDTIVDKVTDDANKQYALHCSTGVLRFEYERGGNNYVVGAGAITTSWQHVAVTVSESLLITLYVNGSPVLSQTAPAETLVRSNPVLIGMHGGVYNSSHFGGLIDDVRMYGRALSDDELQILAQQAALDVVTDVAGNVLDGDGDGSPGPDYSTTFTIDAPLPKVQSVTPAPGQTVSTKPGTVVVAFTKQIDAATVGEESIVLVRSGGDGTFADGNEVMIAPDWVTLTQPDEATMNLAGPALPDDIYQITTDGGLYPSSGLVGHWRFDETSGTTAYDSSGNGHHGAVENGAVFQSAAGKIAGAIELDGVDDYVRIPNSADFAFVNRDFSATLWIYPRSWTTADPDANTFLDFSSAGFEGWLYRYDNDHVNAMLKVTGIVLGGKPWERKILNAIPPVNGWTHLAITYSESSSTIRGYFNGIEDIVVSENLNLTAAPWRTALAPTLREPGTTSTASLTTSASTTVP